METETKTEGAVNTKNNKTEVETKVDEEVVSIPKKDYDTLNQTLGSLKRQVKDLTKPKDESKESKETSKNHSNQSEDSSVLQRLEKMALRQAGLTHQDDIELARTTAKKWGMEIDEVLVDEDFKVKLERQQTNRSNADASANIRGGQSTTQAKNTPEFWQAKGTPPTPADVPDRKTRWKIIDTMRKNSSSGSGKTFWND